MIDTANNEKAKENPAQNSQTTARVTAVYRERYELQNGSAALYGRLKTSIYYGKEPQIFPTVGDFVAYFPVDGGDCQIIETLPRKTYFARLDPDPVGGIQQAVAANFDYVFIMSSLNSDFNVNRIERYIVLSRQSGAVPVVLLTKADLVNDTLAYESQVYTISGETDVISLSIVSGIGMARLNAYLKPEKTVVLLGMSGVGKSSLLNTLMGQDIMTVRSIREDDSRGRHTTTHRQLFALPSGAMVIDTPGMRRIGMWEADDGLSETFRDIETLMHQCRFSDCRHETEPGCAVRAAIENEKLSASRLEAYLSLQKESAFAQRKAEYLQIKHERTKKIAMWYREQKRAKGYRQ